MRSVFAGQSRNAISTGAGMSDSTRYQTPDSKVKDMLYEDLKACPLSREEIAFRLSERAGRHITGVMVDAWVSTTKANRFPAELIPAWTAVLGSKRLIEMLVAEMDGLSLCRLEDLEFAELGRARLRAEKLAQGLWEKI